MTRLLGAMLVLQLVGCATGSGVIYFEPSWEGPSGHTIQVALAQGEPRIYVQQGPHQGGYVDEIAIDPINLQPGDEEIIATRLREELTKR